MSSKSVEKMACPKCQKQSNFTVWKSINTGLDPNMKQKVRSGELFEFICPICGEKSFVNYGFLYHQMEDKLMIYYVQDMENYEAAYKLFSGSQVPDEMKDTLKEMVDNHYMFRIVLSYQGLVEKLCIFDNGLDDRAIELAKVFYKEAAQKQGVEDAGLFFDINENGEYLFAIFDKDGKYVGTMEFPKEIYAEVTQKYLQGAPDMRDDRFDIDEGWALEIILNEE